MAFSLEKVAPRARLERATCGLGNRCSVQLSYRGFDENGPTLQEKWRSGKDLDDRPHVANDATILHKTLILRNL